MTNSERSERTALVVGIDTYPGQPLSVCAHDATEMSAALALREYGFSTKLLLNEECTGRRLRQELEAFFRSKAETYVFYFSGHGWATDVGVYLVAVDSDSDERGIDLEYLKRLVTKLAPEKSTVVVILDCCHAGAAAPKGLSGTGVSMRSEDVMSAVPTLPLGHVVLAACRGDQLAYEDSATGHGVFTASLLQGMLGDAADWDGAITVTALHDYVSRMLGTGSLQTPVFRGDIAGRLVLGTGFAPRSDPLLLNEERAVGIEREAERHLQDYQTGVAPYFVDLHRWKSEGHKAACQMLEPVLNWFDKQAQLFPGLQNRRKFAGSKNAALQRLAHLCAIDVQTVTSYGTVADRMGAGGFGTVWKVERPSPAGSLAYKTYHPQELTNPEKVGRFNRGFSAMKQLDHPNIVRVHDFTKCPLGFYMDFIDGPNLRSFSGTLEDPASKVQILLSIAETLRHAHGRHVVHRDVKPENILLAHQPETGEWTPFLSDFDLAWFATATQSLTKGALGSASYASPEQYATPSAASSHAPTTDVYSFGQLLFFVLTGSDPVPFGVADNTRALRNRLNEGWFSDAAERTLKLYDDCTQKEPVKRPQDFSEICQRLFRVTQALRSISETTDLDREQFVKEVIFSMVGLASGNLGPNSFLTMSRKTQVDFEITRSLSRSVDVRIGFLSQEAPVLAGVSTFEQLRRILMSRVADVVHDFPSSRKRHGYTPPFQVFVECENVPLSLAGVADIRLLISRIVDVMEGR